MPSDSPIDLWELAGTLLWFAASGVAFVLEGPRAGFLTGVSLMLVAALVVSGYAYVWGWPTDA